ncbi:hypothetical protein SAMN05421578_103213 [Paenibacillus macquariensis]|mgnify:CR=1 FL=1|uniref:Uncharacterized protein n=1 Tax=Paenibacillus macquariensis TaxID=948756 RepID=A0ABY1JRH0_9BACL|nr:hypothetical protein SAMN05421578_103213 [Paenibacillus macquariensis]
MRVIKAGIKPAEAAASGRVSKNNPGGLNKK